MSAGYHPSSASVGGDNHWLSPPPPSLAITSEDELVMGMSAGYHPSSSDELVSNISVHGVRYNGTLMISH